MTLRFTPQRWLTAALIFSLLAVITCLGIAALAWRNLRCRIEEAVAVHENETPGRPGPWSNVAHLAATAVAMYLVADTWVAVALTVVVGVAIWTRGVRIAMVASYLWLTAAVSASLWEVLSQSPPLDFAWPNATNGSHRAIIAALVLLAVLALPASDEEHFDHVTAHP